MTRIDEATEMRPRMTYTPMKRVVGPVVTHVAVAAGVVAAGVLLTRSSIDAYSIHVLTVSMIWALFTTGWNLASGFGGMKAFGHQAFFAISGYASALLSMHYGLSPWLTIWLAAVLSAVVSLIVVAPVLRLRSTPQIAIVTLAFGEIVRILIENFKGLTRGEMGLIGIPPFPPISLPFVGKLSFGPTDKSSYFLLTLVFLVAGVLVVRVLMKSRLGLAVLAIRDARDAAESLGLNATVFRVAIFALSAFIVGLSGALFAHYIKVLTPGESAGAALMVMIISMSIIGGHGTIAGPVLGAILLTVGIEAFRAFQDYQLFIYGVLVIAVMRLMPSGVAGLIRDAYASLSTRISR